MEDILYMIALTQVENIGVATGKKLLSFFGNAENVFREANRAMSKINGLNSNLITALKSKKPLLAAEKEVNYAINNSIRVISCLDSNYPYRLKECSDSPILLYIKGNILPQRPKMLSIVGTRNATDYGKKVCGNIISGLKNLDIGIVSGLAYGIDTFAHRESIANDIPTFAVLGSGFKNIYPSLNKNLSNEICNTGCLISEYTSDTKPDRENFPRRNRIIAGLSDATLVVEAADKGGALITAEIANSYNRDIFAVPGRIFDTYSTGCNKLIAAQNACATLAANDIINNMNWDSECKQKPLRINTIVLNEVQSQILHILETQSQCNIDFIAKSIKLPIERLSCELLDMELNGIVKCLPGKVYEIR